MSQEYEYGYDYDDGSATYNYGDDDEGNFDRQVSHNFAPPVVKPLYVSRPEHQTVQRVTEIAHELSNQIGYDNAVAECVSLLVASNFDIYRATQLIFDETSVVGRTIANGDNNDQHYPVPWGDAKRGLLIANQKEVECATCFLDLKPGEGRAFCKHFLCKDCWTLKLSVHRKEWGAGKLVLRCEDVKKPTCFGMTLVSNIEPDLTTFLGQAFANEYFPKHRYQWCKTLPEVSKYPGKTVIEAVNIDGSKKMAEFPHCKFVACGNDDCDNMFEVERELYDSENKELVVGKCGDCTKRTCFICHNKEHSPSSCAVMNMWQAKESDEGLNAQWVLVHTKQCPKCQSMIEKNEGCNHMTCRKCSHEFCWICMGLWKSHGNSYYECNKPKAADSDKTAKNVEAARASLARYTHYYDRYRNHMASVRLDEKTMVAVRKYVNSNFGGENISYLEDVAKVLFDCRYTLANTYVYAYFQNSNLDIFEFNQGRLEHATEELSRIVETCKKGGSISNSQQEIQNKASVAKHYLEILRKGI